MSLRALFHCYLRTAIVITGERIIIIGLQSFGESIDLAVQLCVHVVIDTLPFIPPNSPVEEALAEWLSAQGRDPFTELSVPRASMKLAQWAGRGVRTVTDRAVITVRDTRLTTSASSLMAFSMLS